MQQARKLSATLHELRPLPYPLDALAPHISRETLEHHYGKHHRAYVTKLNELVHGTEFEGQPLAALIRNASGAVFNNAAQVWNHDFYWQCLNPRGSRRPAGALADAIDEAFGSLAGLEQQFKRCAASNFGSGWTWLVTDRNGALFVRNSSNADNPLCWDEVPLLTCDVWEHAYYIDYRNERARYIDAFWQLTDWDFVARRFADDQEAAWALH
jgi:Fe-Mn family superoxide dismutase